jgi:bile acid:Na+ symporter, BASS family
MSSTVFTIFMPVALGLVMFGLGLTLTVADFNRVVKYPKATAVALACQLVVLPAVCFGLVLAFGLQGALAVGMMLLVASPGGITANLLSHLAGGDVALNITLTAINSLLAAFALPVVVGLATWRFMGDEASIGLQFGKFVQVLAVVLIPVAIGVWARYRFSGWAVRMEQPVKIGSGVVLALVIVAAVAQSFDVLTANMGRLGGIALLLSMSSLAVGYFVPRLFRVSRRQSIAAAMEIGIHNVTVAIIVAVSVIGNEVMAIPAAVYGVAMFVPAGIVAYLLSRRAEPTAQPAATVQELAPGIAES